MSYTKTQWNNDTAPAINATNLNKIEQGIYDNDSAISTNATNIGDLTTLTTTANTDLVSAVNELDNLKATKDVATMSRNGLMSSADYTKLSGMAINNSYGTSTTEGYSQNYINTLNTYSTDETRIGTWIDGKPLYRKVLKGTTGAVNTPKPIGTIANLGEIARLDGFLRTSVQTIPGNFVYNTEQVSCYRESNNIIMRTTTSSYASQNCYVIVEYTKTTD